MIAVVALVGLLVLVGGAVIVLLLLQARKQSGALGSKVDSALGIDRTKKEKKVQRETEAPAWAKDLSARVRPVLTGSGPTWAVRSSTGRLLFYGLGAAFAAIVLFRIVLHLPIWLWVPITFAALIMVPRVIVRQEQHRVEARFMALFPDSIDMVVRMVRAGLPVTATMRTLGQRAAPPVDTVFAAVADQTEIGIPLEEALATMSERVDLADFRFFATAVSLQRATGGNLAVTLETLAEIIRKRRAIRMKANAATAEVRISAIVLSCIPFFITGALTLMAPSYLAPLITDPRGNILVGVAIVSLTLAGLTMRWLIRKATMT